MQSILQYRRLRKDLEHQIKPHVDNPASSSTRSSFKESKTDLEGSNGESAITLRDGRQVVIPGVKIRSPSASAKDEDADLSIESKDKDPETIFLVEFDGSKDQLNPKNWSHARKWAALAIVGTTGFLVGWVSSIDSAVVDQAKDEFGVSEVVESLATGLYLIGFAVGSLFAAPFSETVGRNPIYLATLTLLMIFIMASGLAPNLGAQFAFRFIAGIFGCTPLTTFGGSMADMFHPLERTYAFPICCCLSFIGPFIAPLVGSFIGQSTVISWRWTEWTSLILAGLVTGMILLFVPETYAPILLKWKAANLRSITGDDRFKAEIELEKSSLPVRLLRSSTRPFGMFFGQIMVALFTMYLVVIYIILFGFLTGYEFLFGKIYGFSQGSVGLAWLGVNVGFLFALGFSAYIYQKYKRAIQRNIAKGNDGTLQPEERLWFAMYGAPWLPMSLFWMAWTSFESVSYWSCIVATAVFGFSVQCIFISTYQYLIDSYEIYAASALVSATFMRYLAAGVMVVVSVPMYTNLGVHWSLTLLGCLSLLMTPLPYIFYKYGHAIRQRTHAGSQD